MVRVLAGKSDGRGTLIIGVNPVMLAKLMAREVVIIENADAGLPIDVWLVGGTSDEEIARGLQAMLQKSGFTAPFDPKAEVKAVTEKRHTRIILEERPPKDAAGGEKGEG